MHAVRGVVVTNGILSETTLVCFDDGNDAGRMFEPISIIWSIWLSVTHAQNEPNQTENKRLISHALTRIFIFIQLFECGFIRRYMTI